MRTIKRITWLLFSRTVRAPVNAALRLYLWVWDEQSQQPETAYLHRKVIWELRNLSKLLSA